MVLYDMYYNNTISSLLLNLSRNLETTIQKILTNTQDVTYYQQYPPYCAYNIAQLPSSNEAPLLRSFFTVLFQYYNSIATATTTVALLTL